MIRELLSLLGKLVIMVFVLAVLGALFIYLPFENYFNGEFLPIDNFLSEITLTIPFVILVNVVLLLTAVFMYFVFERGKGFVLGLQQNKRPVCFLKGIVITILVMGTTFFMVWLFDVVRVDGVNFDMDVARSLLLGIGIFLVVAIGQELFFRGYLQEVIGQHLNIGSGVIISSLLFMGFHFFRYPVHRIVPAVTLFLLGMMLAITREITGGLWTPLGVYFIWNFIQGSILGFPVSGFHIVERPLLDISVSGDHLISGGAYGLMGSVVLAGILVITIVCLTFEARKLQ